MDYVHQMDLQTLLARLHGHSALLATTVTVPGQHEPGTGLLLFTTTTMIGCVIQGADGSIWRTGEPAYHVLRGNTKWRVHLDPDLAQTHWLMHQRTGGLPPHPPLPPPAPPLSAPRLARPLDLALLHPFSTKQRLIFRMVAAVVNGQRTPEQIKGQLRLPSETVDEALKCLYWLGVIA